MMFENIRHDFMFVLIFMLYISFTKSIEGEVNSLQYITKQWGKGRNHHSSAHLKPTIASRNHLIKSAWNKQIRKSCSSM